MRYLVDESVDARVVRILRAAGINLDDLSMNERGATDTGILRLAGPRIVLTEDKDFGELVVRKRLRSAGVVLVRLGSLRPDDAADLLLPLLAEPESLVGAFTVVDVQGVRRRRL